MTSIHLDYNASTPIDLAVVAAMRPFLDEALLIASLLEISELV